MISETVANRVLDAALSTGGDFAEIFCEDTVEHTITSRSFMITDASFRHSRGVGVRVLSGTMKAFAYTSDLSEESLTRTALSACAVLNDKKSCRVADFTYRQYAPSLSGFFAGADNDRRAAFLNDAMLCIRSVSDRIIRVENTCTDTIRHIEIFNSEGIHSEDIQPRTMLSIIVEVSNGTNRRKWYGICGFPVGFEDFMGEAPVEDLANSVVHSACEMLGATDCPSGRVPVVLDRSCGTLMHEACGHALEATSVSRGNSVFCGKLGKQIASDRVTFIDDGTLPGMWGSSSIDDEGYPTQRNVLIENGILKSYLVDRLGSRTMNHPMTGSSRRAGYMNAPTSRMSNTFLAGGMDDDDEMIRTMGDGLFILKVPGGSVNPNTGDFRFAIDMAYIVKDGRIVRPVENGLVTGKCSDILMRIDRVGQTVEFDHPSFCGAVSGRVPVTVGQPRVRITEMTVGGNGGKF